MEFEDAWGESRLNQLEACDLRQSEGGISYIWA